MHTNEQEESVIRIREVATSAPAKSRRTERRRWRGWTTSLVALAGVVGVTLVPTLGAQPAGASGPSLTTLTGHGGATAPALGAPVAEGSAQVNPTYVAYNAANGDTAIASTKAGSVYVYLIAGASEANEYNIDTAIPAANGPLVGGDVYVMAGTGTAGLIAQPGNNQFGNSTSAVATSNPIEPTSVAFDNNGNVLIAGENPSTGNSAVQVVAKTTGTFYGVSMTAGDLYTIGYVGLSGAPSTAINMGNVAAVGNGMSVDGTGNIAVGDGDGVIFVNEQGSSVSQYGLTILSHHAAVVAGNAQGGTDCNPGATSDPANSLYFQSAAPTFDSSDNLWFSDNETGGVNGGGCVWVEPAHSGSLASLGLSSVTAGDVYKIAGNGGTTPTSDGTAGVQSNVSGTAEVTLDNSGNVVLAVQSGSGFGNVPAVQVLAENTGVYYGTSMTAGDIYTVAGGSGNLLATLSGPTSILNAGSGNLLFTDGAPTSANLDELSGATGTAAPTVTSITPNSGLAAGGTSVSITGTGFTGATAVHFGANAATGVVVNSATSVTATSPAGTGTVDVTVTAPGGTSAANPLGDQFTYIGAPTVTAVSPNHGPNAGGTSVSITGTGFTGATAVHFGANAATGVVVNSATSVTATSPAGTGMVDVTVTAPGGTSAANPPGDQFTYGSPAGGTVALKKTTSLIGNYPEQVSGTGWKADTTVTLNECATTFYSAATCDAANQKNVTLGTGKLAGIFKAQVIDLAVGVIDTHGDTCGVAGSVPCYVVVVGNSGDATASGALGFTAPHFATKATAKIIGNYPDPIKAGGFPIGDTIVAQECDSSVSVPSTVATNCDTATDISMTASATGGAIFSPGLVLRVGSAYSDTAGGTCPPGGTCEIVVTDMQNPSIGLEVSVSFATPAVFLHKTTSVPANYVDGVKGSYLPAGDTITATECDSAVTSANTATNCDSATQVSATVAANGKVVFSSGVPVRDGSSYTDTAGVPVNPGGSAVIVINDSDNSSGFYIAVPITLAP
jgi:hypothetical protein